MALALLLTILVGYGCYILTETHRLHRDIEKATQMPLESHTKLTEQQNPQKWYDVPETEQKSSQSHTERLRSIALTLCVEKGLEYSCVNDLMAMAWTESRFDPNRVGDSGNSYGMFQIHRGYHPDISVEQAKDIEFSAQWTLERLIHYGYPEKKDYAIMKHNGTPYTQRTLSYLQSVNGY